MKPFPLQRILVLMSLIIVLAPEDSLQQNEDDDIAPEENASNHPKGRPNVRDVFVQKDFNAPPEPPPQKPQNTHQFAPSGPQPQNKAPPNGNKMPPNTNGQQLPRQQPQTRQNSNMSPQQQTPQRAPGNFPVNSVKTPNSPQASGVLMSNSPSMMSPQQQQQQQFSQQPLTAMSPNSQAGMPNNVQGPHIEMVPLWKALSMGERPLSPAVALSLSGNQNNVPYSGSPGTSNMMPQQQQQPMQQQQFLPQQQQQQQQPIQQQQFTPQQQPMQQQQFNPQQQPMQQQQFNPQQQPMQQQQFNPQQQQGIYPQQGYTLTWQPSLLSRLLGGKR